MIKKSYEIALKPVSEIRFISQIKVWIKHRNIIRWFSMRDLLSDLNIYTWLANWYASVPLASARLRKLWILWLNNLLDGDLCIF